METGKGLGAALTRNTSLLGTESTSVYSNERRNR